MWAQAHLSSQALGRHQCKRGAGAKAQLVVRLPWVQSSVWQKPVIPSTQEVEGRTTVSLGIGNPSLKTKREGIGRPRAP